MQNVSPNLKGRGHCADESSYIIKVNPQKTKCEGLDWIHLAQDTVQWLALVKYFFSGFTALSV
jgi:hypothetical protein